MDRPYFEWQLKTENEIALFRALRRRLQSVTPGETATRQLHLLLQQHPELQHAAQADWVKPLIDDLDVRLEPLSDESAEVKNPLAEFTQDGLTMLNRGRSLFLTGIYLDANSLPSLVKKAPHYQWLHRLAERAQTLAHQFPMLRISQRLVLLSVPPSFEVDDETLVDLYLTYYRAEFQDIMSFESFVAFYVDTRDTCMTPSGDFAKHVKAKIAAVYPEMLRQDMPFDDVVDWLVRNLNLHWAYRNKLLDLLEEIDSKNK